MGFNCKFLFSLALLWLLGFLQGGGKCPIFPGEVDISSVTRSPWCHGTTPVGECDERWSSEAVKFQMLLAVLCCPRYPRCLCQAQLRWVRARWAGRGLLVHLWLCSPPSNGGCQTSVATPLYLYLSLGLATVCTCCSGGNASVSRLLRAADSVIRYLTLTCRALGGEER